MLQLGPTALHDREERLDLWPFFGIYAAWAGFVLYWLFTHGSSHWYLLQLATYALFAVHALTVLAGVWSVDLRAALRFEPALTLERATHLRVCPHAFVGTKEIVPLERRWDAEGALQFAFSFRKIRFVLNPERGVFVKLKYPSKRTVGEYVASGGLASDAAVIAALERWGSNKFEVPVPRFGSLLGEQLVAPFFCFQVFCVGLWALDEYWYYSLFTLFMLVTFECTVVMQRLKNLHDIRALQAPKQSIMAYRCGKWEKIPGDDVLPGDLVSIVREEGEDDVTVQADLLLIAGDCIADEAVLTGESTPQWKNAIDPNDVEGPEARLSIKRDRAHILFGGTKLLQTNGDASARLRAPDKGCLAVVLRTGYGTAQGRLMRTILYSTEKVSANNLETFLFIGFLLIWAVAASAYVLYYGLADPDRDRFKLALNCIMILTSVVPPELPMELTIAVNASLVALSKLKIFCTEPFRIPMAGKVTTCCFDKTGTLTSDHFVLEGVVEVRADGGAPPRLVARPAELAPETARAGRLPVDSEVVGDPVEKVAVEALGWSVRHNGVRSPEGGKRESIDVLHRFAFSSALKRMSVLARVEREHETSFWVLTKGAPEVVRGELARVPEGYDAAYRAYAAQGARVLALAARRLPAGTAAPDLHGLPRDRAERDLEFAGFAVFRSPLKPESEPTLGALRESGHQLIMITGDAPLTACHAAASVHIVTRPVLISSRVKLGAESKDARVVGDAGTDSTTANNNDSTPFTWVSPDETTEIAYDPTSLESLAATHDLCVTGDALLALRGAADALIPLVSVFARVTPDQKERVVKGAHVGVALLAPAGKKKKKTTKEEGKKKGDKKAGGGGNLVANANVQTGAPTGAPSGSQAVAPAGGPAPPPLPPPGPGTKMLEDMERKGRKITPFMRRMAKSMDEMAAAQAGMAEEAALVKPGDASMAAPFTAKLPNVAPCLDILRQGRCTLVTTLQMFKVLGLLCLSSAYSLSVMYMDGIKLGDLQATLAGVLTAGMFFFISHAKPVARLSRQRPHDRVFCAYNMISLCGQFAVHMAFLMHMQRTAHALMPADERQEPDAEFKPNLINTVCFLVNFAIQTMTFAVNYVGAPFNTPLKENRYFALSINWSVLAFILLVLDIPPGLRKWFSLVTIPSQMQRQIITLAAASFLACSFIERVSRAMFPAPLPPEKGGLRKTATAA
ncbi:hypothetical protein QBZ16_002370 [Prototheca wickerhamii]|uniref:Uncharacterized protein n=1 Tax=Prototheca wickerhamii TaxID=3111 RepID=A0AAD9IMC2_PROWI|nr:hypothetical protein QBZ16_002370 [Prototheca wickerhamii]